MSGSDLQFRMPAPVGSAEEGRPATTPVASDRLLPGWPLVALLAFYPLWWALGLGTLIVLAIAVPMLYLMIRAGSGSVRLPPGFSWWLAFMAWAVLSLVMLDYTPPGTLEDGLAGRAVTALFRIAVYASLAVILVYAVSMHPAVMTARRLAWLLGLLFVYTVLGGILGVLAPSFEFTAPLEYLLPTALRENAWISSMVHPSAAQIQDFLGFESGRPAAPFGYTNKWGANLALLLPFFLAAWVVLDRRPVRRVAALVLLAVALLPILYSMNRGLWLALILMTVLVVGRAFLQGHRAASTVAIAAVVSVAALLVASPLGNIVEDRLQHQHSNVIREFSTTKALQTSAYSPVVGFGTTRRVEGSARSIGVGRTADCANCGNTPLGQNGHVFLVLISHGYVGVLLFYGMFVQGLLRWWRRDDALGLAGLISLTAGLLMSFYYDMLVTPLLLWMLGFAVLCLSERRADAGPVFVPTAKGSA